MASGQGDKMKDIKTRFARKTKLALGTAALTIALAGGPMAAAISNSANAQTKDMATSQAGGLAISAGVGWHYIDLPETKFTLLLERPEDDGTDVTIKKFTDHDGDFNGYRFDGAVDGLMTLNSLGMPVTLGVKGFYAEVDSSKSLVCDGIQDNGVDCGTSFLFDPSPVFNNKGDAAGLDSRTRRKVYHWGVAAEGKTEATEMYGAQVQLKGGAAYRTFDQSLHLSNVEVGFVPGAGGENSIYNEDLDTDYWGAYVGLIKTFPLFQGVNLVMDGEAGVYYAQTDYSGRLSYNYSINTTPPNPRQFDQALSLSDDDVAFIGALNAQIDTDIGFGTASLFALGEYYSSAPRMVYADADTNTQGIPAGGIVQKTEIKDDDAWTVTLGGRVTVPIH